MEIIGKTTIHPVLFFSGKILGYCTWILFLLALFGIRFIPENPIPATQYVAYGLVAIALFVTTMSLIHLGSSTRLGLPTTDTEFKQNGVYRFSRNPMYLGFNLITVSAMLYFFNGFIAIAGLYSIVVYHLIILGEEKYMGFRFGEKYRDYKKKVRRYI